MSRDRPSRPAAGGGPPIPDRVELLADVAEVDGADVGVEALGQRGDQLRLGVVEDVVHLGRGEPPVDGDDDRIEFGRAIGQREVLGDVLADEADPVLVADAGRGKGVGHLGGLAIELGECEGAIVEDEGDLVGLFVALATQVLGEVEHDDDSLVGDHMSVTTLSRTTGGHSTGTRRFRHPALLDSNVEGTGAGADTVTRWPSRRRNATSRRVRWQWRPTVSPGVITTCWTSSSAASC